MKFWVIFTEKELQSLEIVGLFEKLSDCIVCEIYVEWLWGKSDF